MIVLWRNTGAILLLVMVTAVVIAPITIIIMIIMRAHMLVTATATCSSVLTFSDSIITLHNCAPHTVPIL